VSTGTEDDILPAQSGHLREAQPGLNSEQEEGVVPAPAPGTLIRSSEQSFHLGISQESDQPPRLALIRNDEDLLDSGRFSGLLEGDVAEEGTNGGETKVAGANHIVALFLTMI